MKINNEFLVEVYENNYLREQYEVKGVNRVLELVSHINKKGGYIVNTQNIMTPFPCKFMIVDKSFGRSPEIINDNVMFYAWFLSYKKYS